MVSGLKCLFLDSFSRPLLAMSAFIVCTSLVSCQKLDSSSSQVLHSEGQLKRADASTFVDCHVNAAPAESLSPMQASVNRYLRDMANGIMMRTNESLVDEGRVPLFIGALAPEKFCFLTPADVLPEINAAAMTSRREINFKPYSFLALPHEPALAAIMCHELAHVTLSHGTSDDVRPDIGKTFMSGPDFEKRFNQSRDICNSLNVNTRISTVMAEKLFGRSSAPFQIIARARNEVNQFVNAHYFELAAGFGHTKRSHSVFFCRSSAEVVDALSEVEVDEAALARLNPQERGVWNSWLEEKAKFNTAEDGQQNDLSPRSALRFFKDLAAKLDAAYGAGRNSFIAWKEQEADEVGFEMCLRAGVDISSFSALQRLVVEEEEKSGAAQCLFDIEAGSIPDRTLGTHPSACWRIFDIEKREQSEHGEYYQRLLDRIPRRELLGDERLGEVLEAIRPLAPPVSGRGKE